MFEVGRVVCYRAEGVCKITDIREEAFGGSAKKTYYVLTPVGDEKSTVYVPCDNDVLVGFMRPLLSAEEICRLVEETREERMEWIPESRFRNTKFREILANGDRRELLVLLFTLMEHAASVNTRKPSTVDENAARRARKLLLEEFSVTTDLETEEELCRLLTGERLCQNRED